LYYYRWIGTAEEWKEYVGRIEEISGGIRGVNLKGMFCPSSDWDDLLLFESASFDRVLEIFSIYIQKYGTNRKVTLSKFEMLFTPEERGYSQ
jgi:hypothetical protein